MAVNSNGDMFVGGYMGRLYRSTDDGATWNLANNGILQTGDILSLAVTSTGVLYTGTYDNLYRSTDNGDNWTALQLVVGAPIQSVHILHVAPDGAIYAANYSGNIYYSVDAGDNWSEIATGGMSINALAVNSSGNIFTGSWDGVRYAPDTGGNFVFVNNGLPANVDIAALAINGSGVLFAGGNRSCYISTDNGANWSPAMTGLDAVNIMSFAFPAANTVIAGTENGVFISTDNGANWSRAINGYVNTSVNVLLEHSNGDFFAGCEHGLYTSVDGISWTSISLFDTLKIEAVINNSAGDLFVGTGIAASTVPPITVFPGMQ